MPGVDLFMDEIVADFRRRLALLGDGGDRRAIEDGIALLAGLRLSGIDAATFEELLSRLRAGRASAGHYVLQPEKIAGELARRWQRYAAEAAVPALN